MEEKPKTKRKSLIDTRQERKEETLRHSGRELAIGNRINEIFLTMPDDQMYGEVLGVVLEVLKSKYGVFAYIDEDGAAVCPSMTRDIWEECKIPDKMIRFPRDTWANSIWARAIIEKRPLYSNKPGLVPKGHISIQRALVVPILHEGEAIGHLHVANKKTDYDEEDVHLLETIADKIAPVLHARLQRDIQERKRKRAEEELERQRDHIEKLADERAIKLWMINSELEEEIAERKLAEKALRRVNRALKVLSEVNQVLIKGTKESNFLYDVCQTVVEAGGYRLAWVGLAEQDEAKTVRPVAQVGYEEGYLDTVNITYAESERGRGPTGTAIRTGKPSIARNILNDPNYTPWRTEALKRGYASSIAIPLINEGQTYGALNIYASEPDAFCEEEEKLLAELANNLAYGILMLRMRTEKKKTEDALINAARQWRSTFDAIHDAIILLNFDSEILRCNLAAAKLAERPFKEMIGHVCHQIIHGTTGPVEGCPYVRMKETLRRETQVLPIGERWFNIVVDPLLDENGNLIGGVHISSDITEQRQAEAKVAGLEEQVRQSQRMEAIGRLAGGVAHDFNNLLTIIKGYSQLSLLELKEGDPLMEDLGEIQKATERAESLTRQLLAFSRRQILDMRVIDLNTILQNLEKMLRRVIGEDIELIILLAEGLGPVKTDPGQIEQVLLNLAVNARDAMPKGGKLTVETANIELDETDTHIHPSIPRGRYVMLSVSDTGVGMTREVKDRAFEPFFTTKDSGKGTGLGLSTVYGIVTQSHGNIFVYSEPGQGTTFKIYLPRVDEPLEQMEEKIVEVKLPTGTETVMVVEDEEEVRKLAVQILRRQGYNVLEALQGGDALLICEQHRGPIHLMLTDVIMPRMNGRELAERLTALRPEMKVIYMSGYTDDAIVHHGVLRKGTNFIQKPFTMDVLVRKVRKILDSAQK